MLLHSWQWWIIPFFVPLCNSAHTRRTPSPYASVLPRTASALPSTCPEFSVQKGREWPIHSCFDLPSFNKKSCVQTASHLTLDWLPVSGLGCWGYTCSYWVLLAVGHQPSALAENQEDTTLWVLTLDWWTVFPFHEELWTGINIPKPFAERKQKHIVYVGKEYKLWVIAELNDSHAGCSFFLWGKLLSLPPPQYPSH